MECGPKIVIFSPRSQLAWKQYGCHLGKCWHLFPSTVLELLLRTRTALPQVTPLRIPLQNTAPQMNPLCRGLQFFVSPALPTHHLSGCVVQGKRTRRVLGGGSTILHGGAPGRHYPPGAVSGAVL